jgi:cyclic pyranopterin phosphate synthase
MKLYDRHDRSFPYLRLSVTEVCNFSCTYCLPEGYQPPLGGKPSFMTVPEMERLVRTFEDLGVHKIRLTGGEPTLRKDFLDIVKMIAKRPAIKTLAFTTNGYKLRDHAEKWHAAGLNAVNVSIDSFNRQKFLEITGHDRRDEVLEGVEKALEVGFKSVKINVVLLKGVTDVELGDFMEYVKGRPISVRFIELMQTGDNKEYFDKFHLSADVVRDKLQKLGWIEGIRAHDAGPAQNFSHADYEGSIGIIAPYSKDFCKNCNRLRITAKGDLRLCLFGEFGVPLRPLLQKNNQQEDLTQRILKQLTYKKSTHFLESGLTGIMTNLSSTGG